MSKPKTLRWGETPWDNLSREELLREVQRMYAAVSAMYSALRITAHGQESGYWGPSGTGGSAIEMGRQIVEPLRERYGDGMYRAFFRYALDLLFEQRSGYQIGHGWAVCPECGRMAGDPEGHSFVGRRCAELLHLRAEGPCAGVLRPLEWADLEKRGRDG